MVLADLREREISDIICLGDVVGYGPNPKECVDLAEQCRLCLMGNHEEAVLHEAQARGFNPKASRAVGWTASQFDMLSGDRKANAARWDFMGSIVKTYTENSVMCVHGSPCDPTREYVYTTDIRNPNKMERIFELIEHICFVGHTHVPGVITGDLSFRAPADVDNTYQIDERKTIINVGSVGQPRDFDPRACYVLWDGTTVEFVRVPYDFERTAQKIYMVDELDDFLGNRLKQGR